MKLAWLSEYKFSHFTIVKVLLIGNQITRKWRICTWVFLFTFKEEDSSFYNHVRLQVEYLESYTDSDLIWETLWHLHSSDGGDIREDDGRIDVDFFLFSDGGFEWRTVYFHNLLSFPSFIPLGLVSWPWRL